MKRYHGFSYEPSHCSMLKQHCFRQNSMTSPSQFDCMESHLWADWTHPQNGCKNTTNDRQSEKNTHTHSHNTSQSKHILMKRIREFTAAFKSIVCLKNCPIEWSCLQLINKVHGSSSCETLFFDCVHSTDYWIYSELCLHYVFQKAIRFMY